MRKIKNYLSLVKFSHTIFALPFAFVGFFYALYITNNPLDLYLLLKMLLCMIFGRNAAMSFNRYLDRNIDKLNHRTQDREIPLGKISGRGALFFSVLNVLAFIITTYFINSLVFLLSFVAIFVILFYSYTKRFTFLCHLVLGLGLSLAPIGAFLTVLPEFQIEPIFLSIGVLFWTAGFDVIYAFQDYDFDTKNKLYSIPSILGKKKGAYLAVIFHVISILSIFSFGLFAGLNYLFFVGSLFFLIFLIYQHLVFQKEGVKRINLIFFTLNGIASVVFAIFSLLSFLI